MESLNKSLLSKIELLTSQLSELKTKVQQLTISKANKNEINLPESIHHFEARLTNNIGDIYSEFEYKFATSNQPLRFITEGSSTLDFNSGDPFDFFKPPKTGYYRVALSIHGCDTFSRLNDPLLIYFNEYEIDENDDEQQTNLSLLMTGIYQEGPKVSNPIDESSVLNFNTSFIQTYYGENTIRLDSNKKYKLFMTADINNSIPYDFFGNVQTIDGLQNGKYDISQIDTSIRQLFFITKISKLFVNYLGPTHPI